MDESPMYDNRASENQIDSDMEQAQQTLEQLRKDKEAMDQKRAQLEELRNRKADFIDQQNDLGERMVRATDQLKREVEDLRAESDALEQILRQIAVNLRNLGHIRPEDWIDSNTDARIQQSMPVLTQCSEEFEDLIHQCSQMKYTKVLNNVKRSSRFGFSMRDLSHQFIQGLAFHLPLLVIALFVLLIIWLTSPAS